LRRLRLRFVRTVTKKTDPKNDPEDHPADGTPRKGKRVTWTPAGNPGDGSDTPPASEAWGESTGNEQSNDEQLKRDKPPHWG
jgi:hypothetical protein